MAIKGKLSFCGGSGSVTGANFLFQVHNLNILVDCGLEQGGKMAEYTNWESFPYDPKNINYLIVTHAHLDHIGRIPKLVYEGFKGQIISTPATRDLARVMLEDTASILSSSDSGKKFGLDKMYSKSVLGEVFSLWRTKDYHEMERLSSLVSYEFSDAGHILGSAMVEITVDKTKIIFTGDLGNTPSPILKPTEKIKKAKYLLMESVYGDRNHENRDIRRDELKRIVLDATKKGGVLMIPIFSMERTQEFLYELDTMVEEKEIPRYPVFVDSPLAIKVTKIFKKYKHLLNKSAQKQITEGDDVFSFPGLKETEKTNDSKAIVRAPNPKIIMAGSGMSMGGRILHHEKHFLGDKNSTILFAGYQTPGTLGRKILDGAKRVIILDKPVEVRANIERIQGYSGHKDSDHLVEFVGDSAKTLKKVFLAMGEPKAAFFLAQRIKNEYGLDVSVPDKGESVELEF